MRKFFGKFLFLFVLIFLSIVIPNLLYINTNYWQGTVINPTEKFNHIPDNIQIANVGSSHGECGFDYREISNRGFNFALSQQYPLYDYLVLKQYVNQFDKNAVLLIPISYFHITSMKIDFKDHRARYYRFLSKENMDVYSEQEKILFTFIPVLTAGKTIKFIIKDRPPSSIYKTMTEQELIKDSIEKHGSWTAGTENTQEREKRAAHNKYLVSQIIELCYTKNIQPVLVTTPFTSILNNVYAEKTTWFFDDFYRFTHELQEAYHGLPCFDYSHDPRFENDFSLFRDCDHLGAEKFTAIVISDLQTSGLLSN